MFPVEFQTVFKRLGNFYNKNLTDPQSEIWFEKLQFLEREAFETAVERIIFEEKNFPTPKVVLDYAKDYRAKREDEKQEDCPQCRSTGFVTADNPKAKPSSFSFRCGCANGKRLSSTFLSWGFDREKEGWVKR